MLCRVFTLFLDTLKRFSKSIKSLERQTKSKLLLPLVTSFHHLRKQMF